MSEQFRSFSRNENWNIGDQTNFTASFFQSILQCRETLHYPVKIALMLSINVRLYFMEALNFSVFYLLMFKGTVK